NCSQQGSGRKACDASADKRIREQEGRSPGYHLWGYACRRAVFRAHEADYAACVVRVTSNYMARSDEPQGSGERSEPLPRRPPGRPPPPGQAGYVVRLKVPTLSFPSLTDDDRTLF